MKLKIPNANVCLCLHWSACSAPGNKAYRFTPFALPYVQNVCVLFFVSRLLVSLHARKECLLTVF